MRLSKLAKAVNIDVTIENEREISALCIDTKAVERGSLYICLRGENADGHAYAGSAVQKGAAALVVEEELPINVPQILVQNARIAYAKMAAAFYNHPTRRLKVIGITGTNGKTTVSYMLQSVLQAAGKKVGVIGTLGVCYGEKTYPNPLTTPDPHDLQRFFAEMEQSGVEYAVIEVSAHALYYSKVAGVEFSACIFTNLTQDHLDFFKDMAAYKQAKKGLFLPEICPVAIVNADDATGREFAQIRDGFNVKTTTYGLTTPADAFAVLSDEGLDGADCLFNVSDRLCRARLKMVGRHNVYNALAVATCAAELGIDDVAITKGLSAVESVNGRLQEIKLCKNGRIFVDFAHTPDGLEKSLTALKPHCKGRLICLFGCGGNRDKGKRSIMGEKAAKNADLSVLTSDNPRYEDPLDILAEVEKGHRTVSPRYVIVPDRRRAISYALDILNADDVLLIAGKGGEEYQEIMGIKYPFNDQAVVKQLLEEKGKIR